MVGEDEIKSNKFTFKNMRDGNQEKLPIEVISDKVSS